ncbi:rRNA maturation RNase YbeY [Pinibacter aurantiacus]|uniref:Endoribonuclease YbeY n=1 Tax=Pinibacter aurantiacus TaxID=2851599 RepID=A0A9E2SA81_9BACT|nr:rRNA maturation RNase YbeY [Pinibacter aurantiacus]MBV4356200.1 rRNA maturation RNase YbeY [Pinibacter aurantiacus]
MNKQQTPVISFHFLEVQFSFTQRTALKQFLIGMFKKEKKPLESLNYVFCSDEYLLEINNNYLQHNYYTDIVTFELSATNKTVGDIYISVDRVKDNAENLEQSFKRELHRVIFHGALHLCGYRDKTAKEQEKMREMEDKYLKLYFK